MAINLYQKKKAKVKNTLAFFFEKIRNSDGRVSATIYHEKNVVQYLCSFNLFSYKRISSSVFESRFKEGNGFTRCI